MATPFPLPHPPPPLALLTAQQEPLKIYVSICIICMPYSRISQVKKVFNLANAIQRHFKSNYHCTNNKF